MPRTLPIALAVLLVACGGREDGAAPAATESPGCANDTTPFVGDCDGPPPIDPETDLLVHYGPSNLDDPQEVEAFVIQPGEELVDCVYHHVATDSPVHYDRYDVYSRPGSHHVILNAMNVDVPEGTHDRCTERDHGARLLAVLQGGLAGAPYHYPPSGVVAPENAGLGTLLEAHQAVAYELHAVNATDAPLLRENWTVFHTMPESAVTATLGQLAFNGGFKMQVPPHTIATVPNSCPVPTTPGDGPTRVVDFFGHMHSHGTRFSAWVTRAGQDAATRTLIYESYDWSELDLIELNSVVQNPPVEYRGGSRGGMTGVLELLPGDRIEYECEIDNTESYSLHFAARAFEAEMCNLFGSFTPGEYWPCLGD